MTPPIKRILALIFLSVATASSAAAHVGIGDTTGFWHGFMHPLGGLDHEIAMFAVGLFAAHLGGRALWLVPGSFVLMMAVGGALGIWGIYVPWVEAGIAASVIVLGILVAMQANVPIVVAMAIVGFFSIFHGHAHGAEMPADTSGFSYAIGFMLATALLHALGIAAGIGLAQLTSLRARRAVQVGGAAMTLAGVGIASGVI